MVKLPLPLCSWLPARQTVRNRGSVDSPECRMSMIRNSLVHTTRGFTLIELLMVIAIIGLLASVILASIGNARSKGVDSHIQRQLVALRSHAEIYASDNGNSYNGFCTQATSTTMLNTVRIQGAFTAAINTTFATAGSDTTITCHDNATGFAIDVPLRGGTTTSAYCVDAQGRTRFNFNSLHLGANSTNCP